MFVVLKPLKERKETADQVVSRLRGKLSVVAEQRCSFSPRRT